MRLRAAVTLVALACAGCGGARPVVRTTTAAAKPRAALASGLRVGVVGPLALDVAGIAPQHGRLAQVADAPLVLADARVVDAATLAGAALEHPASHFALVGGSTAGYRLKNLVGLVLEDEQAARIAGIVAGFAAADGGGASPRVAWVGPEERRLAAAFGRGVHDAYPDAAVLHQWSRAIPARCKEAALTALQRGAVVVMAHGGKCADAAAAAAHQQNLPALRLGEFERPGVAAGLVARDAAAGIFHAGEDIVFGAATGAIGVRTLDPLISSATAARARVAAQQLAGPVPATG